MEILLTFRSKKVRIIAIYRPKPSKNNKYTLIAFYKEFTKLMSHYNLPKDELIICRDFNFHVNKPTDTDARRFTDILSLFNLTQHINKPTHKLGNTLDLLISRKSPFLYSHKVDTQLSNHNNILFKLNMIKTPCPTKVNFRKLKSH